MVKRLCDSGGFGGVEGGVVVELGFSRSCCYEGRPPDLYMIVEDAKV